jgi:hypothetical protein
MAAQKKIAKLSRALGPDLLTLDQVEKELGKTESSPAEAEPQPSASKQHVFFVDEDEEEIHSKPASSTPIVMNHGFVGQVRSDEQKKGENTEEDMIPLELEGSQNTERIKILKELQAYWHRLKALKEAEQESQIRENLVKKKGKRIQAGVDGNGNKIWKWLPERKN